MPAGGRKPLYEAILGKLKILVPHPCGKASTSKIAGRREPQTSENRSLRKPVSHHLRRPSNRHAVATSLPLPQSRCSSACLRRCPGPDFCCRCQRRRQGSHCCLRSRWHLRHCSGTPLAKNIEQLLRHFECQSCQLCAFFYKVPNVAGVERIGSIENTTTKMLILASI